MESNNSIFPIYENHELSNSYLSFDLYKNIINTACNYYRESTNIYDPILRTIAWFERRSKYLFLVWLNQEHNKMASYFKTRVEIDSYQFINFFEILDIWFSEIYNHESWETNLELMLSYFGEDDCTQISILQLSVDKLIKLSAKIIHQLYQNQYSIDPYCYINQDSVKEKKVMDETLVYAYFLKDKDQQIISEYIDSPQIYENISDDAMFYQTKFLDIVQRLYSIDPNMTTALNKLLQYSFTLKISHLRDIKQSLKNLYGDNDDFTYTNFFTSLDTLNFYILSESVQELTFSVTNEFNKELISTLSKEWAKDYSSCTEETVTQLCSYLILLLHSIHQYTCTHVYERYGVINDPLKLSDLQELELASDTLGIKIPHRTAWMIPSL